MTPQSPSCRLIFIRLSINVNPIKPQKLTLSTVFNDFYAGASAGLFRAAILIKYACAILCSWAGCLRFSAMNFVNFKPWNSITCMIRPTHHINFSEDSAKSENCKSCADAQTEIRRGTTDVNCAVRRMESVDVYDVFETRVKLAYPFQYSLKEEQITVIRLLVEKKNVMACLSTGFGKSDCFLVPPLLWDEVSANFKVDQSQGDINWFNKINSSVLHNSGLVSPERQLREMWHWGSPSYF